MNLPSFFRSFLFVAAAALVGALLLGLIIGSVTGVHVRPLVVDEAPPARAPKRGSQAPSRVIANLERPEEGRPDVVVTPPPIKPDRRDPPRQVPAVGDVVVQPARPLELADGPVDVISTTDRSVEIKGTIFVQLRNNADVAVTYSILQLQVDGGPLGWLAVPGASARRTETPGEWCFDRVMAGRYRVSSLTTGYAPASQDVEVASNALSVTAILRLERVRSARVEFVLMLPDRSSPREVRMLSTQLAADPNLVKGRFGEHKVGVTVMSGSGARPARMPLGQDGVLATAIPTVGSTEFQFIHEKDGKLFRKTLVVQGSDATQRFEVELEEVNPEVESIGTPAGAGVVTIDLTFIRTDGKPLNIQRVNLRQKPDDALYFAPGEQTGARAIWSNLQGGQWYAVVEAAELDAPFIAAISAMKDTAKTLNIDVGTLVVRAGRDPGSPRRGDGKMAVELRIRPRNSGALERRFNRELGIDERANDATYTLPAGPYTLLGQSEDGGIGLEPASRDVVVKAGISQNVDFTVRAACKLKFVAVDATSMAIAGIEFLVSFNPSGMLRDDEKAFVILGGADGRCQADGAPYGPVYLHVWTSSTDFLRPDKVFKVDLPAYGEKDLGALVLGR